MATGQQLEVARVSSVHSSSFLCQKCCQPLKLDTSFYAVDQRTFNELTGIILENLPDNLMYQWLLLFFNTTAVRRTGHEYLSKSTSNRDVFFALVKVNVLHNNVTQVKVKRYF